MENITITRDMYRRAVSETVLLLNEDVTQKVQGLGGLVASMMGMHFAVLLEEELFGKQKEEEPAKDIPMSFEEAKRIVDEALKDCELGDENEL